jgi:predicted ribosomally synthesized peptide with nif11-like leader
MGDNGGDSHRTTQAMSEEQLSALLAKLKEDAGLQEKLKGAGDLDAAVAMAKEAGFDVSKADWLKYQANQTLALTDDELEGVTGGYGENPTNQSVFQGCY